MDISVCVLTRNRSALLPLLLEGFKRHFPSIRRYELVIADNSSDLASRLYYNQSADRYIEVSDAELWHEGFSFAKGKAVGLASNQWVAIADLGESWRESIEMPVVKAVEEHPDIAVFRIARGSNGRYDDFLGHVFDKKRVRLLGLIHETPVDRKAWRMWSPGARDLPPVAYVEHGVGEHDPAYEHRKQALYDHLIEKIVKDESLRAGTAPYWWTDYWEAHEGRCATFDEWKGMPG